MFHLTAPMTLTIEHLPQHHCFQAIVNGQRCDVDYRLDLLS